MLVWSLPILQQPGLAGLDTRLNGDIPLLGEPTDDVQTQKEIEMQRVSAV